MPSDPDPTTPFDEAPVPHEDLELVRAALGGDRSGVRFLAERAQIVPRVLSVLNRRWGGALTPEDVEDLAQDVVMYVLQKLAAYQGTTPFDAWLYRFCVNQLRNRVRREVFRRGVVTNQPVEASHQRDLESMLDGETVWSYVEELDEPDREIVRLKHGVGMSFAEIGQRLDLSASSVKTRYYRTLRVLRSRAGAQRMEREAR